MRVKYRPIKFSQILLLLLVLGSPKIYAAELEDNDEESSSQSSDQEAGIERVEKFVENIGNEIINILVHRHQSIGIRKKNFRAVLKRDFDMPAIAKFIMARYWRQMSEKDRQEYIGLFVEAAVENYAAQFDYYSNEKLVVKSSRQTQDGGFVVSSLITRPGKGQPLKVKFKVFETARGMKVVDIEVDGVSMSITLRSEYTGVYNNRGGIEGLLGYLREKIAKSNEKAETSPAG